MNSQAITTDTTITRNELVLSSDLGDEFVMMDVESGDYFNTAETGARIWALIEDEVKVGQITQKLALEYDVAPDQCEKDVIEFVDQMCAMGIAKVV